MRSLADDLRARSDVELAALVRARPDLLNPVPADVTALAQRAGSPASVAACLRDYDQLALHVVLAAALGPDPVRTAELVRQVAALVPGAAATARVRAITDRMRADALLWGGRQPHLVGPARDLLAPADRGPRVAALDPVVARFSERPETLQQALTDAPHGVRSVLDRLLAGPVIGSVADARRVPDPGRSPVDWLLAHHVLLPLGDDRVVLPAEVVAILRGGSDISALPPIDLAEPAPRQARADSSSVDEAAVGTILDALHRTAELGRMWAESPPARLRTGGISARDLTRTARALSAGESEVALLIEVAGAAGLVGPDLHGEAGVLPTTGFDPWLAMGPAAQHATLLTAWLNLPRGAAGPGERAMAPGLDDATLPGLRRDVLGLLAGSAGGWSDDEIVDAVDWWAPRRHDATRAQRVLEILEHSRSLGLLVAGTLTGAGHALLADDAQLNEVLARSLPGHVDTLILQADLTAIVPGLPTPELGELMRAMADPESVGAASTYRFSTASVRRALDSGRTAGEMLGQLRRRAEVPQPLAYVIEDVARRHAVLQVGTAATFVRCDDPVQLAAILADPGAVTLELLQLSDTVLVSRQAPEHVLDRLRDLGHTPIPDPVTAADRGPRRARGRPRVPEASDRGITPAMAAAAVRAVRANDRTDASQPAAEASTTSAGSSAATAHPIPAMSPPEVAAILRAAIADGSDVWIGYADPTGVAGDRRVEPLRLVGGYLTALDQRSQTITSFALARVTGVAQ